DVSQVRLGAFRLVLVNTPDLAEEVLVTQDRKFSKGRALQRAKRLLGEGLLTSEGVFHRDQRRTIQPLFHRQRIAAYGETMVRHALRLSDRWQDGETIDIGDAMARLTLTIVGEALFATDVEDEAADVRRELATAVNAFNLLMLPFSEVLDRL